MSLFKRAKWWWTDFSVNGVRYRLPLKTRDWREAQTEEKNAIARATEGKLSPVARTGRLLAFATAAERYKTERKGRVAAGTWRTERDRMKPLTDFFGEKRLASITADNIRQFQAKQTAAGKHPRYANHQVKLLCAVLRRARLPIPEMELLRVPKPRKGRVLEPKQKLHLFEVAASKPEWQVAYCAALLTANCSLRPCEIRALRWKDVDAKHGLLFVPKSKTDAGVREVPLNAEAVGAIVTMRQRADRLGTYAAEHYVFHRIWPAIDATRPMSGWRSAWRSLREAAGLPKLRYYSLRSQCITEMLELGVPEGVIREVVGHVDPDMLRWYSDVRRAAKRAAVEALSAATKRAAEEPEQAAEGQENGASEGGYDTIHVTNALPAAILPN